MTSEEEELLQEYLLHQGEIADEHGFEPWCMQRFQDVDAETHYKRTLELAQVWKERFEEDFQQGVQRTLKAALKYHRN